MLSLPRRRKFVRIAAALPLLAVAALLVWLILPQDASRTLEAGDPFPHAQLKMIHGRAPSLDSGGRDVLVFFRPGCEPCRVQTGMLERSVMGLGETRLYMVSTSPASAIRAYMLDWPMLAKAKGVSWASIGANDARQLFGVRSTPTIVVFDNHRMVWTRVGIAMLSSILDHADSTSDRLDRNTRAQVDRSIRDRSAEECESCEVEQVPNGRRP